MTRVIGIAGGSGSGKSTLATALYHTFVDRCALLHLDDYYKELADIPMCGDRRNFDHPDALRFADLCRDIQALLRGESITISTKSEVYNPDYDPTLRNSIIQTIHPREILIVEGYLVLHDACIRDTLDFSVYLDMPIETSMQRRSGNKAMQDQTYFNEVLIPMHERFVAPTARYADLVIQSEGTDVDTLQKQIRACIEK